MKKLIISANPSTKGFTHKIVKEINTLLKIAWDEIKILDLYSDNMRLDFLDYEEKSEMGKEPLYNEDDSSHKKKLEQYKKILTMQDLVIWADEIIFVFPIWWWSVPSVLKNFFDCVFMQGFAYKYEKGGKLNWLLKWRQVRVLATSWWPSFVYSSFIIPLKRYFKVAICMWVWMKLKSFKVFGNMNRSKTNPDDYLKEIHKYI